MYNLANARRLAAFKLGFWQKKKTVKVQGPLDDQKKKEGERFLAFTHKQ